MSSVRVILAEDQLIIRASFRSLLAEFPGVEVVAEASTGEEAISLAMEHRPDVVLMDISMPGINGLEATRQIVAADPKIRIVILSMHTREDYVRDAFSAGVSGYVFKGSTPLEFKLALESVSRGEVFLSPSVSKHVIGAFLSKPDEKPYSIEQLTTRQREILQLIAEGKSSKEVARLLDSSVKTIEAHRARLMARLGIHDLAGLVRYAVRHGITSPEA
jgi:DNA-binding NarL/FixJ family response regulator